MIKYQIVLHLIVLIWGLTGILGDNITLSSSKIVFFRTLIAFLSLYIIGFFIKNQKAINVKTKLKIIGVGIVVGLHWFTFFYAIKVSTISIGVVCMSMTTLFVSFIEPLIFKRKIAISEIIISVFILIGIIIIFGFEFNYIKGIIIGLFSALMAALFSVLNGKMIQSTSPFLITKFEMLGALLTATIITLIYGELNISIINVSNKDWAALVFLGFICTSFAFLVSVWVMKFLSPFTVSIAVNMEPVYTIIIAMILYPEKEKMSLGFYFGGLIIIGSIFTNAYLKKINRKKIMVD